MTSELPFTSIHRHGLVRVAAARPRVTIADPAANADSALELARQAHDAGADLVVFPELCISAYAIDDLHLQQALLDATESAVARMAAETSTLRPLLLIGAAVRRHGRVYNCAVAVHGGRILGVVPKTFLPNYREFYEKRWFASGHGHRGAFIGFAGRDVPFGVDLLFEAETLREFCLHVEICEDLWSATPPSTMGALAGATVLCNLSASNITIAKADERALLCSSQSNRCAAAYVYAAAGAGESTTDLAWDGQSVIYELGEELAASDRFGRSPQLIYADVDVRRLQLDRMRTGTFNDAAAFAGHPETGFRRIGFKLPLHTRDVGLERGVRRFPFVPNRPERLAQDCYEAFNIQVDGLVRRMEATGAQHLVIGVSGGLDSTHALIVAAKACDLIGRPRSTILGYTMPGFATSEGTKANAWKLMRAMGIEAAEIDIKPAARQMLSDMGHPFAKGEAAYDITFENVQAGLRTDYLFRLANHNKGFVVGTGDLSELALGWATYGVGDHMSHYAVNCGVPKTLIQYLIRWTVESKQLDEQTGAILKAILEQEISPELIPADAEGGLQSTEDKVGPYGLNDFFLYYTLRQGQSPSKIAFLAWHAWRDKAEGGWPAGFPEHRKEEFDLPLVRQWLHNFVRRFFVTSQFKRSAIPNGPKVLAGGSLSPRGDWRAPSDSTAGAWLEDLETIPTD
jgi:NAD+ synthase (glutamine-hydrolysing)